MSNHSTDLAAVTHAQGYGYAPTIAAMSVTDAPSLLAALSALATACDTARNAFIEAQLTIAPEQRGPLTGV